MIKNKYWAIFFVIFILLFSVFNIATIKSPDHYSDEVYFTNIIDTFKTNQTLAVDVLEIGTKNDFLISAGPQYLQFLYVKLLLIIDSISQYNIVNFRLLSLFSSPESVSSASLPRRRRVTRLSTARVAPCAIPIPPAAACARSTRASTSCPPNCR